MMQTSPEYVHCQLNLFKFYDAANIFAVFDSLLCLLGTNVVVLLEWYLEGGMSKQGRRIVPIEYWDESRIERVLWV